MSEPTTKSGRALHDWLGWHPIDGRDDRILAIEVEAYERGCVAGMAMEKYAPQPDTASRSYNGEDWVDSLQPNSDVAAIIRDALYELRVLDGATIWDVSQKIAATLAPQPDPDTPDVLDAWDRLAPAFGIARPAPDTALDEERLASAIARACQRIDGLTDEEMAGVVAVSLPEGTPEWIASLIAREYAALAATEGES